MKTFKSVMLSGAIALAMTGGAFANDEKPKYGGSVEIGTVYVTLSALSWDAQDFNWKHNHDTGLVYEQLFAADLSKSVKAGGKHPFVADAWLPSDAIRGELAESWEWKENPLRIEIKLRKGIMWPDKPGVMKSREFVADDVLFAYTRLDESPRKIKGYFDHIAKAHALDKHTVVFEFKDYFAEWDYRFGYGYFSGIYPKEVVEAGASNWKNVNGTGPYMLTDFVSGNSNVYTKNEGYWDKDKIGGQDYKLPFIDKITYRTIKDEATYITALRTGKLDILESIRWQNVDSLKKSAPQLKWNRWLNMSGTFLAFRVDVDSIERIDAAGDYMCIYTADNSLILRETMKDLERRLDPRRFQRVHRSTIVNLDLVKEVKPHTNGECFLVLQSNAQVKVSRSYRDVVARFVH